MPDYTVTLAKDLRSANNLAATKAATGAIKAALAQSGVTLFGAFTPLFGLASNELYLVTFADERHDINNVLQEHQLEVRQSVNLEPTVRPTEHSPRTRPGIYVFRWFSVYNRDVDEIARLSDTAWTTFEGGFDTQVQGLFAEPDRSGEQGTMLLITWYRNLSVWEDSRSPAPEARENFLRRARLTIEARPIATRLALPE